MLSPGQQCLLSWVAGCPSGVGELLSSVEKMPSVGIGYSIRMNESWGQVGLSKGVPMALWPFLYSGLRIIGLLWQMGRWLLPEWMPRENRAEASGPFWLGHRTQQYCLVHSVGNKWVIRTGWIQGRTVSLHLSKEELLPLPLHGKSMWPRRHSCGLGKTSCYPADPKTGHLCLLAAMLHHTVAKSLDWQHFLLN